MKQFADNYVPFVVFSVPENYMLGPKKPGDPSRWLGAGRQLKASKDGVYSIVPDGTEFSFSSVSVVSFMPSKLVKTDVESVYFMCIEDQTQSAMQGFLPAVAKFNSIGEVVILSAKQTPIGTYVQGLLLEDLMKWKPPKKANDVVAEDGLLSLWKLPNADVEEFKNVSEMPENVCEKIDSLLAVLATFKRPPRSSRSWRRASTSRRATTAPCEQL